MRGFIIGSLALILLEVFVTSKQSQTATTGAFAAVGNLAQAFIDPTRPAFKQKATTAAATTAAGASATTTPQTVILT